jgi:molybdenum cofactor cytidylyltransferase
VVSAIVPAAGAATRFGGAKLQAIVRGRPLLDHTVGALLAGGCDGVVVVTGPEADWTDRIESLRDPRVTMVVNKDPSRGMLSSIQAAVAAVHGSPVAILPGDMPFVRAETVAALLDRAMHAGRAVVSPMHDGRRGHPILIPSSILSAIAGASPTSTLADVLRASAIARVDVDVTDPGVLRDVDVQEDLAR